jgi:hypothetical protein
MASGRQADPGQGALKAAAIGYSETDFIKKQYNQIDKFIEQSAANGLKRDRSC